MPATATANTSRLTAARPAADRGFIAPRVARAELAATVDPRRALAWAAHLVGALDAHVRGELQLGTVAPDAAVYCPGERSTSWAHAAGALASGALPVGDGFLADLAIPALAAIEAELDAVLDGTGSARLTAARARVGRLHERLLGEVAALDDVRDAQTIARRACELLECVERAADALHAACRRK